MKDTLNRQLSNLLLLVSSGRYPAVDDGIDVVRTLVRLRDRRPPAREDFWATPVEVDDRGRGTYMVRNNALLSALQVGDVVQVDRDWNGCLTLTGIARLSEGILTEVHFPHDERDRVVKKVVRVWRRHGAHHTE